MGRVSLHRVDCRYGDGDFFGATGQMKSKNVVAALRRDATYVWQAAIAVVFIGFASLAVASAVYDLLPN